MATKNAELSMHEINRLVRCAQEVFRDMVAFGSRRFPDDLEAGWSGRSCAVFGIFRIASDELHKGLVKESQALLGGKGGNYAQRVRYLKQMCEKARRTAGARACGETGRVSSYETRDPENDRWGGAVIMTFPRVRSVYIVSTSGLPEKADEALGLLTVIRSGLGGPSLLDYCRIVAQKSDSDYWDVMYDQLIKQVRNANMA